MYRLCDLLRARGCEAWIYPGGGAKNDGYGYLDFITEEMERNDIVVYPEVVRGNPCRFRRVARYVLYFPGVLGGSRRFRSTEAVFTWDKKYYDADVLYQSGLERDVFLNFHKERDMDCVFVHKGGRWKDAPELAGLTEINMDYPATRKELVELLNRTRVLYSFDAHSVLNEEALLCGVRVKTATEQGWEDYVSCEHFDGEELDGQVERFIAKTQSLPASSAEMCLHGSMLYFRYKIFMYRLLLRFSKKKRYERKIAKYQLKIIRKFIGWDGVA